MTARPFLKWAGGKTQLLPELLARVPETFNDYHEPFLGGGALFWALWPPPGHVVLGDRNTELIGAYQAVRDNPGAVVVVLKQFADDHSKEHYHRVRAAAPSGAWPHVQAARTIYLNKTGFNGLYGVNQAGQFNVPWGKRAKFEVDDANIFACSKALKGATLVAGGYEQTCQHATEGDLVYFDPPYMPVSVTANFTAYTKDGFGPRDQEILAYYARDLKRRGVHVLLSTSIAAKPLYEAVGGFKVEVVQARRNVNRNGAGRGPVEEILVS